MFNREDTTKKEIDVYKYYQKIIKDCEENFYSKEHDENNKLHPMKFEAPNYFYKSFVERIKNIDFKNVNMEAFVCGAKVHFGKLLEKSGLDKEKTIIARETKIFFLNPLEGLNKILNKNIKYDLAKYSKYEEQQKPLYKDLETYSNIRDLEPDSIEYRLSDTRFNNVINENEINKDQLPNIAAHLVDAREKYNSLPWYKRFFKNKEAKEYKSTIDKAKNAMIKYGLSKKDVNKITTKNNCKHNLELAVCNKEVQELNNYKKKINNLTNKKNAQKFIDETFSNKNVNPEQAKETFEMLKDIRLIQDRTDKHKDAIKLNNLFLL